MIVAINGNLIDTKNIFKITPISKEKEWDYDNDRDARHFLIVMFNNISLEVFQQSHISTEPLPFDNPELAQSIIRANVEASNVAFDKLRESIINVWSDNQSDIPQFNS